MSPLSFRAPVLPWQPPAVEEAPSLVQVAPNPRRRKQASPGEADLKRVQLAPSRRKNSLELAAEAVLNLVQVAPKSRKNKNLGKAAEAAQSHSAVCAYSGFRSKRLSKSTKKGVMRKACASWQFTRSPEVICQRAQHECEPS